MWICCDKYYYDVHLDFKNKKQNKTKQKQKKKKKKTQNKTKQKTKQKNINMLILAQMDAFIYNI